MSLAIEASPKPKLRRAQLPEHFRRNGLPPLSLSYINKLASLGDGPPIAMIWNRICLYDPDESLDWLRAKVKEHTRAAQERQQHNRELRRERLERLKRQAEGRRQGRVSSRLIPKEKPGKNRCKRRRANTRKTFSKMNIRISHLECNHISTFENPIVGFSNLDSEI